MIGDSTTIHVDREGREASPLHQRFLFVLYQEQTSRELDLPVGGSLVFGRDSEVEVPLEDSQVSRRHARLWRDERHAYVEDLGSTNGTQLNGVRLHGPQRLGAGDAIGIGRAIVMVSAAPFAAGQHRILTDGEFEERLEAEVDRSTRYRRPLSLVMLHLPPPVESTRSCLAALIALLRRMDLVASYSPRDYACLLPELDGEATRRFCQRLQLALPRAGGDPVRVGAASMPADAHNPGLLLATARERLRQDLGGGAGTATGAGAEGPARGDPVVVAESKIMVQTIGLAHRIGAVNSTALILGETGSGKQVVAEAIHRASARASAPFCHVNCAALPANLIESELFGHEQGAFTGASSRHLGYVESARGGTLFLDEIGELPLAAQPKLLLFLEKQTFSRVGGVKPLQGDVRLIAATNRDLGTEAKEGRFRDDLYFRLSVFVIRVPALRERREDILPLAERFCAEFAAAYGQACPTLSERARATLLAHDWPGNVRQLRNAMERAVVLAEGAVIDEVHLPERVCVESPTSPITAPEAPLERTLAELEARTISQVLRACKGNQSKAARQLGITRRALIYRLEKLGLR